MSEDVHYKGELTPYPMVGSIEDAAKEIVKIENYDFDTELYDNYEECLEENGYRKYVIANNKIYVVNTCKEVNNTSRFKAILNHKGIIEFEIAYYNGGCSFIEALEEALENMENNIES